MADPAMTPLWTSDEAAKATDGKALGVWAVNGVSIDTRSLKPGDLLDRVREIEQEHGRVRLERWGSRTLDIDIITYGTLIKAGKRLELPHPRAYQRAFVLVPWALMNPAAVLPGHGSVAALAKTVESEVRVVA